MIILKNNIFIILLAIFFFSSCSVSKKIEKELNTESADELFFKGISVVDAESGEPLIEFNSNRYFTPASNVKLFTLYAAWQTLGDSISSFEYAKVGDSLILKGTANPLFLSDSLDDEALEFLKGREEAIYLKDDHIVEETYGQGWSWDDYPYYYMPEKSIFPIYGNVITIDKKKDSIGVSPNLFDDKVFVKDSLEVHRDKDKNKFYVEEAKDFSEKKIPFKTSNQLVADLLGQELSKKVILLESNTKYDFKSFKDIPYDTLYRKMMVYSDNFMAEQIMLRVGKVTSGEYSVSKAITYTLEHYLNDIPQRPRWVDGSGLSRYNLFSPKSITFLLRKMYHEIPHKQLFAYLPQGGVNGTLKSSYKGQVYLFAKSGTLSNNYSLSGFLTSKNGKVLIFSYMNNHYSGSSSQRKEEMSGFFKKLYESY